MIRALAAALALSLLLSVWLGFRLSNEQEAHAETRAEHAQQITALERAARAAEAAARVEEKRRADALQEVAHETEQKLDAARADAVAAVDAGQRLRTQLAAITSACGRAPGNPGAADSGTPASATADLLADVQRRLDEAADAAARFADSAHTAGTACERSYDSLTTR